MVLTYLNAAAGHTTAISARNAGKPLEISRKKNKASSVENESDAVANVAMNWRKHGRCAYCTGPIPLFPPLKTSVS